MGEVGMESRAEVHDFGNGNTVSTFGPLPKGLRIDFKRTARDCALTIGRGSTIKGVVSFRLPGGTVTIGERNNMPGIAITVGRDSTVVTGEHLWFGPMGEISAAENTEVSIGDNCLIGTGVMVRADDAHPFYDLGTGKRLNPSKSTVVSDDVWMGRGVAVLAGARIGAGSIIGTQSVVTANRPVPSHAVAAGNPARVIRRNVKWLYKHLSLSTSVPSEIAPDADFVPPEPEVTRLRRFVRFRRASRSQDLNRTR